MSTFISLQDAAKELGYADNVRAFRYELERLKITAINLSQKQAKLFLKRVDLAKIPKKK